MSTDILEISKKEKEMKIYITDLEAYNNGHLVGEWYTLPISEDDLLKLKLLTYEGYNEREVLTKGLD